MDHVVVDVEIQKTIGPPDNLTWDDTDKLGVACAVLYDFGTDRYHIYGPQDVEALKERLLKADRVSGFNTWKFDFPVIWALHGRERVKAMEGKSNDILRRIWIAAGANPDGWGPLNKGWSLNNVVAGTLRKDVTKSGNGADAPKWFQAGKISRLHTYCLDDVRLERDLVAFVDKHSYVVNGETGKWLRL